MLVESVPKITDVDDFSYWISHHPKGGTSRAGHLQKWCEGLTMMGFGGAWSAVCCSASSGLRSRAETILKPPQKEVVRWAERIAMRRRSPMPPRFHGLTCRCCCSAWALRRRTDSAELRSCQLSVSPQTTAAGDEKLGGSHTTCLLSPWGVLYTRCLVHTRCAVFRRHPVYSRPLLYGGIWCTAGISCAGGIYPPLKAPPFANPPLQFLAPRGGVQGQGQSWGSTGTTNSCESPRRVHSRGARSEHGERPIGATSNRNTNTKAS